jgi:hypothetical protein
MFLAVRCQQASGACQSHSRLVLSLREASRKYAELSHSTPPFLALPFHEKDLPPTPRLLQVQPILPPLGCILSIFQLEGNDVKVSLRDFGSYVIFKKECYHKGYKSSTVNTYLTAQLFAAPDAGQRWHRLKCMNITGKYEKKG